MITRLWKRVYLLLLYDLENDMQGVRVLRTAGYTGGQVEEALMEFTNEFVAAQAREEYQRRLRARVWS